jgi:hypothetical protein
MGFAKGQKVIKVIRGGGTATCSGPYVVKSVKAGKVGVEGSEIAYSDRNGLEVDPALPGWCAEIVYWEGGA